MPNKQIRNIASVIAYIEAHLTQKLNLDILAEAMHYSKYHLHRIFTDTVGLTIHDYIQRRRLSEAAKLLIFSEKSVLDIALLAGYESQQALRMRLPECTSCHRPNIGKMRNFIRCS